MNLSRGWIRIAVALLLAVSTGCARRETARTVRPHAPVIIISIDTLRADRLPAYGHMAVQTPAIDALRRDSVLFTNAYAHVPMTLPSHVSLLTGTLPYEHGVRNNLGYSFDAAKQPTISSLLKGAGYATGAAVSAYVLRGSTGLAPAFDFYDDVVPVRGDVSVGELARPGLETGRAAEGWISERNDDPFFFLFHIFEPHAPYEAPEPFRSRYTDAYDAEVAASDAIVGRFLDFLKARGIYDRAIVILLSDHGEGLGDHGEGEHGVFLYRESLRVPLMLKLPAGDRRGTTVERPVQMIDVLPTVAQLTGVTSPRALSGTSLLETDPGPRAIYAETMLPKIHFGWSELRALVDERYHMIDAPRAELYDLTSDPRQLKNVRGTERRVFAAMEKELRAHPSQLAAPAAVDPEEAARLAALGYLGSVRSDDGGISIDPKDGIADLQEMKRAASFEKDGKARHAIAIYRQIVVRNPRFADAWLRLAAAYERLGNGVESETAYRRAIEAAPSLAPGIALSLGNLLMRGGKLDDAQAHAELALTRSPAAARLLMARIALARRDLSRAEAEARAAMSDPMRKDEASVVLAAALAGSNRTGEALALLDQTAAGRTESLLDLHATRGDLLARSGRMREAKEAFQLEIASFPRNREAYTKLAVLQMTESLFSDAEATLEQMYTANRSRATAMRASETWAVVGAKREAARWRERADAFRE